MGHVRVAASADRNRQRSEMWDSPFFLQEYARQRTKELSQHSSRCRLGEQLEERRSPPRWRRLLARRLASLSVRLDNGAALAALEAGLFLR